MHQHNKFHVIAFEGLRLALSVIYVWFGALKIMNVSPVLSLVAEAYPFIASSAILYISLGILEVVIGVGIMIRRISEIALWTAVWHLIVVIIGVLASAQAFTSILVLSFTGEFVIKNFVLAAAALVLISHDRELRTETAGTAAS